MKQLLLLALLLFASGLSVAQNVDNNSNNNNNNGNTNNSNNTTTIINNTTIVNNNNGNNNSNSNNASGTSGVDNATNTGQSTTNGSSGNNQGNGQNNGGNNNNPCSRNAMPAANFENLKTTIKAQRVESNKPLVIKQAVVSYQVSVSQVKDMMKLISVEQYRLDVAKYLYDHTCDQANYFEVNGLLNSSRVRDLEEYLKKKRGNHPTNNNNNGQRYNQQSNNNYDNDRTDHRSSCNRGSMPERDFDNLQSLIKSTSFSDSKQNIIKQAVPGKCISAVQVKQLMSLFSFEADKLSVAKYLYPYTSDQNNYFMVNEVFSFSTSIDELQKYIENNR